MKVLLLTFYFAPDLSAGSFRSQALAHALLEKLPDHASLDVVTTLPNRYASFAASAPEREKEGNLTIHRVPLPSHQSGVLDQSKAFLRYAWCVLQLTRHTEYDLVLATSSRLMTAVLGSWVARRCHAKLYLDLRDIFVENLPFLLPRGSRWLGIRFFGALERWAVKRAVAVNLVSPGFEPYFRARYPGQTFTWHTNGVDTLFAQSCHPVALAPPAGCDGQRESQLASRRLTVLYAGNIGQCQGIERVLPGLAKRLEKRADFVLIGDGGRREALEQSLEREGVTNVVVRPPIAREQLLEEYRAADVLFLHLNDMFCFSRVIPSKLFEYAATGKPILAGVRAFPAQFCQQHIDNAAVFEPCDPEGAVAAFDALSVVTRPRDEFVNRFRRDKIMSAMADDIVSALNVRNEETVASL